MLSKQSCLAKTLLNDNSSTTAKQAQNDVAKKLVEVLDQQFQSFKQSIFLHIDWFNCRFWSNEKLYQRVEEIKEFASHIAIPLAETSLHNFNIQKKSEKSSNCIQLNLPKADPCSFWKKH